MTSKHPIVQQRQARTTKRMVTDLLTEYTKLEATLQTVLEQNNRLHQQLASEIEQRALAKTETMQVCRAVAQHLAQVDLDNDDDGVSPRELLLSALPENLRLAIDSLCQHGRVKDSCYVCGLEHQRKQMQEAERLLVRRIDDMDRAMNAAFSILRNEERTEPVRGAKRILSEALERKRLGQFG